MRLTKFFYIPTMAVQKTCLGVEISQNWLKVALVEPARKHIAKVDVIPTSGNSMEDISIYSSVLGSWVRDNSFSGLSSISVAFPACNGIIRLVAIPKNVEDALEYANWEFSFSTDFKMNDYCLDAFLYPNEKKPERAIVTAMRRKLRDSFCAENLSFTPDCLIADVCALLNLLEVSEGLGSEPKCILKADEKFIVAFWGNITGPLAIRLLPIDNASPGAVADLLDSGYRELPKTKRNVKLCGTLPANNSFATELAYEAKALNESINVQVWDSLSRFSLNKSENFSKLSQCLGAVGAIISYV